jgi:hypothetical protein
MTTEDILDRFDGGNRDVDEVLAMTLRYGGDGSFQSESSRSLPSVKQSLSQLETA